MSSGKPQPDYAAMVVGKGKKKKEKIRLPVVFGGEEVSSFTGADAALCLSR